MPKVTGPLHSLTAKGRFGDSILFSSWLGRPYVKLWRPSRKGASKRQAEFRQRVRAVDREWAKLSREQRKAWQAFALKRKPLIPAYHCFLSHASLAVDAGFPVPALPPKAKAIMKPHLKAIRGEDDKSLVLSWSFSSSLSKRSRDPDLSGTPYPLSLMDLWLQVRKPSCRAYEKHYKHYLYVPASLARIELKGLPKGMDYHLKARFLLPDSSRSPFAEASA
jgi:hypothetical protein